MGAELLRHQSSRAYFDGNNKGCMWDLFRFLDLHQHLQKRKMLSYRRQGDESNGGGTKFLASEQNVDLTNHKELLPDTKANFQMKKKLHTVKKSSSKGSMLTLIYRKLTNKKNHKSSSNSRLLRTISIHHLECNDYVLPGEIISDSDSSTIELNSHEIDFSSRNDQRENIPLILRDKIQSVEDNADHGNTIVNHLKEFKRKIKDVIKENKKKEHQISMDGVLDKVPIDHKLHDEVEREKRNKFGSEGFVHTNSKLAHRSIQRSRSLTEESSSVREPKIFHRRSNSVNETHSLSESLDRYSRLLESVSVKEPERVHRLNSIKEQENDSFAKRRTLRSHSLSESFNIYSRLLETVTVGESQRLPLRSNSTKEKESNFTQRRTQRPRYLSESLDVYSCLLESVLVNEPKIQPDRLKSIRDVTAAVENYSFDETNSKGSFMNTEESMETEISVNQNGEPSSELIDEHDQSETGIISEGRAEDSISEETEVKEGPNDKRMEPILVYVLDSCSGEDPVSPAKHAEKQGAELQSSWIQFVEQDSSIRSENILADISSEMIEHIKEDLCSDTSEINSFKVKDDDEFNYVKNVLEKSGFSGGAEEFLAAWLSSYEPIDQLLFVEESSLYHQLLLDLVNEALLEIYESTIACNIGLSRFSPRVMPVLMEARVLKEVWAKVRENISSQNLTNQTLEQIEARDFAKNEGWMNLAWDTEILGVELEDLILDDLVDEIAIDFRDLCEVC